MKKQSDISPFGLRLQEDLRKKLDEKAGQNNRSLNAEITSRLQTSIEAEDKYGSADAGDPASQFLAAIDTIRAGMAVAEKAMLKMGVKNGQIKIREESNNYNSLTKEQRQLLEKIRQLDKSTVQAMIELLSARDT